MRVLVLGGYGLIGEIVVRHLIDAGHSVIGLGRHTASAKQRIPDAHWIDADLRTLTTPSRWQSILSETAADSIVNCAGALQDGARDSLATVQSTAMQALYSAALDAGIRLCIQISAPRASPDADTMFMRTKGEADAALVASNLEWVVLRPGLVLGSQAYGGTALIRALAAMPVIQFLTFSDRLIQTVDVNDIAKAVVLVHDRNIPTKRIYDLVEDRPHTLAELVAAVRAWLGLPPPKAVIAVPTAVLRVAAFGADMLGWLGWRSPLRSTAITELSSGVTGDPKPWRDVSGQSLSPLHVTLRRIPSTVQERWFARCFLVKPMVIATLAGFWLVTGLITLANPQRAVAILTDQGSHTIFANAAVFGGALLDLALGAAALWRRWMPTAAVGMIGTTLAYLAGGTLLTPSLWADPLGPLVKAIPAMCLAVVALALAEDR